MRRFDSMPEAPIRGFDIVKKALLTIAASVSLSISAFLGMVQLHQVQVQKHDAKVAAFEDKSWKQRLARTANMRASVVQIEACSGVMVAKGLLLTAAHCDVGITKYDIVKKDEEKDLMLVRYEPKEPYGIAPLGSSAEVGDVVRAVGYPLAIGIQYVTPGMVQDLVMDEVEGPEFFKYLMTATTPVIFGNSGGGLFNANGELIGIASRMATVGYGAPVTHMAFFVNTPTILQFLKEAEVIVFGK